ncbi:transaldolase [Corynebacterium otitidis]|uniref:Transaldolase n=1 Tax=Corynebacterium otitidis ATCC 51513 TaxID=883169 RepID=I7IX49_9CORY|nr:transaldolase [Corynebacterium otitidis]EJZ82477.1 transaldolase [Corynebacterium otitidis ATCC 51513]CCI83528.1 Transaldolase [Corynebacterium otitidis ATCC 51513]
MTSIDRLAELGTTTWLDDLSRERLDSGNLASIIEEKSITGVTTNPSIFKAAMTSGTSYDEQIAELKGEGAAADDAVYAMSIADVQRACDVLRPVFDRTDGEDGRVSIEVDPRLADDGQETFAQALGLWSEVDRPNAMIKIPATPESLPAIEGALAEGVSVNVTLIFSVERYREVIAAYKRGIERAKNDGRDVSQIRSVASFFVSRMDTEVDKRLEAVGGNALELRGLAGLANARAAYALFESEFGEDAGLPEGAHPQRPLWASTGVKNPDYPATLYVAGLAGPRTVNTMPEKTIDATLDSDVELSDTLSGSGPAARETLEKIRQAGVDLDDVTAVLEREGVEKFVAAWKELLDSMAERLS